MKSAIITKLMKNRTNKRQREAALEAVDTMRREWTTYLEVGLSRKAVMVTNLRADVRELREAITKALAAEDPESKVRLLSQAISKVTATRVDD